MKTLLAFFLLLSIPLAHAIQNTGNLDATVTLLEQELETLQDNQKASIQKFNDSKQKFWNDLALLEARSEDLAIAVYSQNTQNIFAMAYACKQIRDLYNQFINHHYPFAEWQSTFTTDSKRFAKLRNALQNAPTKLLSAEALIARDKSIESCKAIEDSLAECTHSLEKDNQHFQAISSKLTDLENFTNESYGELRTKIFLTGGLPYPTMLAHFSESYHNCMEGIYVLFYFYQSNAYQSFLGQIIYLLQFSLAALVGSFMLTFITMRWLLPRASLSKETAAKSKYYLTVLGLFLFSLILLSCRIFIFEREFIIHVSMLLIEFTWMICAILISLTVRLSAEKIARGLSLYAPIVVIGFFLILFRILVVANDVVHLILPTIFTLAVIIMPFVLIRRSAKDTRTDLFYAWLSFALIVGCTILSWAGYRFMGLQIMMLWLVLLTAIQTLIAFNHWIRINDSRYQKAHGLEKASWFFSMMHKLIIPLLTILLFAGSFVWSAHIFDMADFFLDSLKYNFVNIENVAKISADKIIWLICLAMAINYLIYIVKEILRSIYGASSDSGVMSIFMTIGTMVFWAGYIFTSMIILNINYSGVMVVMGGLSMGIGFAMKETIDNLICGLSLVLGRVRMGDVVECDGIRGKISSIGYRSTTLETVDGSIIAFLNNQLFTKNFKNFTKNHSYELAKVLIGVAYGTNIEHARQLILTATRKLDMLQKDKQTVVNLDQFGASSIDLTIAVWVPVRSKGSTLSAVREAIYQIFEEHNINIPFPQQDVYVRNMPMLNDERKTEPQQES